MSGLSWHLGLNQEVFIVALGIVGVCMTVTQAIQNGRVAVAYRVRVQGDAHEQEVIMEYYPNELRAPPPLDRPVQRVLVVAPPRQPAAALAEDQEDKPNPHSRRSEATHSNDRRYQ